MTASSGLPSASGARVSGDDYQHTYSWLCALELLRPERGVVRIELEARDAGNVDDLIVRHAHAPALFHQIKFAVDQRAPLDAGWFITASGAAESPLARFQSSFRLLTGPSGPPEMVLITNRLVVPDDPILRHLSGREDKLVPRLASASPGSASGRARRAWADYLGVGEDELLHLLAHLSIRPGRASLAELRASCATAMAAAGLSEREADVDVGVAIIRRLVGEGCRSLGRENLAERVRRVGLMRGPPEAILLVDALKRSAYADHADARVDWLELFPGDTPQERRQLHEPGDWTRRLKPEIGDAVQSLQTRGLSRVRIDGAFRLSIGFALGEALARTAGFTVAFREYRSDLTPTPLAVATLVSEVGAGQDLAVGISVNDDLSDGVLSYIAAAAGLPVGSMLNIAPALGVGQYAIPNPAAALGFVDAAFTQIRAAARGLEGELHLFLACPNAIAILLGHLWNRVPNTQVYEDANRPGLYFPTFRFAR